MKLCKKKMAILLTVLCLMVVMVFVFCSFAPPVINSNTPLSLSRVSLADAEQMVSIVNQQKAAGSFNSLIPVLLYSNSSGTIIYLVCVAASNSGFSIALSGSNYVISNSSVRYRLELTSGGFSVGQGSGSSFAASDVIAYRSSNISGFSYNTQYAFTNTSVVQDPLIDLYNSWGIYVDGLENYEQNLEDSYFDGIESGYEYGYAFGYEDGYSSGVADGYDTGYDIGYMDGDRDGYESGYSDGYDYAYSIAERETVIIEPADLNIGSIISGVSSVPDNILNGTFDFELFGINVYGLLKVIIILFVISAVVVFVIKRSA